MTPPIIGFGPDADVFVDLDRLVASRALVQANSGGGKSRALRYLLEQTHGRLQHIVLDPEGEFASLRERFDYVLAAKGGDVPADLKSVRLLCRRLMELGASAVVDIYDLPLSDRRRFVKLFLEELMHLPRALWRPVLVAIDEAHVFCPERGSGEAESTEAVITLCTQGRKRGYCAVLATQRLSKLHKDAAAELLNKLIGRTGLDVDVKRAGDDLGFDKDQRQTLKTLAPGTFYAYGPAIAQTVTLVRTGEVVTSHPEAGRISAPPPPAPAAVQRLLGELRDLPQQAEDEARTVDDLQRQLRAARSEVTRLQRGGAERVVERPVVDEAAIQRSVARAVADAEKRWEHHVRETTARLRDVPADLRAAADAVDSALGVLSERTTAVQPGAVVVPVSEAPPPAPRRSPRRQDAAGTAVTEIGGTSQRMLNALALLERLGIPEPTRANVAGLLAISWDTGTFRTRLSELRTAGFIDDRPGMRLVLTDQGRAAADPGEVPTLSALHALWLQKLGGTAARMLEVIIGAYPRPISREAIARTLGVEWDTGTFRTRLSELRTPGLIRDVSRTELVATDLLFPEGLR